MRSRLTALLFAAALLLTSTAWADSQARIVRLSYLEGDVQLDRGDGGGFIRAFLNMPLIERASVWTKEDGRAEIEFEDGSTIRLAPNTILVFTALRLRDDGSRATVVDLSDGVGYFHIRDRKHDTFQLSTGARAFTLEKTAQFRVVHNSRLEPVGVRVAVQQGELRFTDQDGRQVALRKRETLTIDFLDAGRYFLAKGIPEEAHDYWDRERDRARENDRVRVAQASQSTVVYVNDLHHYGTFFTVAGYGRLWRPFHFGISWDPFARGSWVYYPGAGYVWVSDYSWGWTPYRYGSWVHIPSRGWCWQAGGGYNNWARGPVIINAPRGYVRPAPPVVPVIVNDRIGNRGVVRVGHRVRTGSPDARDRDGRDGVLDSEVRDPEVRDPNDLSPAYDSPRRTRDGRVLIQDRTRGVIQVDRRTPTPIDGVSPARLDPTRINGDLDPDRPRRSGRFSDGGEVPVSRGGAVTPARVTGEGTGTATSNDAPIKARGRIQVEGEIGTQRDTDTPVITYPAGGVRAMPVQPTPVQTTPVQNTPVRTMPVQTMSPPTVNDRPMRTPRNEMPTVTDRPTRTPRTEMPTVQPERMSPPPQSAPPPQRMQAAPPPSAPPPQRMSAPPVHVPAQRTKEDPR